MFYFITQIIIVKIENSIIRRLSLPAGRNQSCRMNKPLRISDCCQGDRLSTLKTVKRNFPSAYSVYFI